MNKVIGENEKCVFYFMEKVNGLFGQPSTLLAMPPTGIFLQLQIREVFPVSEVRVPPGVIVT